jgi:hypothetical protein
MDKDGTDKGGDTQEKMHHHAGLDCRVARGGIADLPSQPEGGDESCRTAQGERSEDAGHLQKMNNVKRRAGPMGIDPWACERKCLEASRKVHWVSLESVALHRV